MSAERLVLRPMSWVLAALLLGAFACESHVETACGQGPSTGGHDVAPAFPIEMGATSGRFDFHFETRNAKDRVQVRYEGEQIFDSGCVGTSRDVVLDYGPGEATQIEVVISPNCESGALTSWLFDVQCPLLLPTARLTKGGTKAASRNQAPRQPKPDDRERH